MHTQALQLSHQLKSHLKKLKETYPNMSEFEHFYRQFKKLDQTIKQLCLAQEKTPAFFQLLHDTTIDMRMKLLHDLAKSEDLRKKIEGEHQQALCQSAFQLQLRNQQILRLERLLKDARSGTEVPPAQHLQKEVDELKKQVSKLKEINKDLMRKLSKSMDIEKTEIKKPKQVYAKLNQRGLSPSLDPVADSRETKTDYENILGSLSELPHERNFTEWDHNFSQQETERKARSAYTPNSLLRMPDELWRLIYIQALTVEEFVNQRS